MNFILHSSIVYNLGCDDDNEYNIFIFSPYTSTLRITKFWRDENVDEKQIAMPNYLAEFLY